MRIESVDGSDLGEARLSWPNAHVGDTIFHDDRPWIVVEVVELEHGHCSAFLRVRPHLWLESHTRIRARFGTQLVEDVRSVVNRHDIVGLIGLDGPEDEYEPEIEDILARLPDARTVADATAIVQEVHVKWFGWDEGQASRAASAVFALAAEIWAVYTAHPNAPGV